MNQVQLEIQNSINYALGSEKSRNKAKKTIRIVEKLEFHLEKFWNEIEGYPRLISLSGHH